MNKARSPTLEDVARLSGVSTATISRALNEPGKVAKATLERIEKAVGTLGYTPNSGARLLASNRTLTVGAVIPTMSNAIFASGIQAFQEELSLAGMTLLIASTGFNPDNELAQIRKLMAHGAGGLLLVGSERPAETRQFLDLRKVPHVVTWCHRDDPSRTFVGFDNEAAAFHATEQVLARGHRHIAVLSGHVAGNDRAADRIAGARRAIAAQGDTASLAQVIEAKYSLDHGAAILGQLLANRPQPTAIVCGNDVLATSMLNAARQIGLDVPRDLSVIGFDDISLASAVYPPLTTVRVPHIEMGRRAAQVLLGLIDGDGAQGSVCLATEFVLRETLGPPRAP